MPLVFFIEKDAFCVELCCFIAEKEFRSQCHIFRGWTLVDIERKLYKVIGIGNLAWGTNTAHEVPFVALLVRV